jgi:hypothetical protein
MSSRTIIERAAASGVQLTLSSSGRISVKGRQSDIDLWLPEISQNKNAVLKSLRAVDGRWSAEDWQAFFDERAAIAEFDGGLPRAKAEMSAYDQCVTKYMALNPPADLGGNNCRPGHEHDGLTTAHFAEARAAIAAALTPMKEPST